MASDMVMVVRCAHVLDQSAFGYRYVKDTLLLEDSPSGAENPWCGYQDEQTGKFILQLE